MLPGVKTYIRLLIIGFILLPLSPLFAASGDKIGCGNVRCEYKALDAEVATTDGVWLDATEYKTATVHITGITTATVKANISNAPTKPAAATHDIEAVSITADGLIQLDNMPVRWIKVRISSYTSGTISAFLVLSR